MNDRDLRLRVRVLTVICVLLLLSTAVLAMVMVRNNAYRAQAQQQFSQRMINSISSAVDEVNRMSGVAASDTSARLSRVRQYIYHMDQLNDLSMKLAGGENGRLVSAAAFTTIYQDLDNFESVLQGSKSSTLDIRTQLLADLTALQTMLSGN